MSFPGISREDEERKLKRTIRVANAKVEANKQSIRALAEELHAMQEEFDESDKETQTLWHDADARFKFVNQDLKRAEQARKKPYFGRIDFRDKKIGKDEAYYIGRSVIADNPAEPEVIDWRAPIASVYYDSALGNVTYSVKGEGRYEIELCRKRTYEIENETLKDFYDSDVVANDELLTKYLARNKRAVLGEIIATIQQEQNEVIRKKPQHNLIVQGAAGSGKTTVAMHRISYILYNYEQEFAPEDFYIIGSNQVLLNYITGVLPELNVYGVRQMTMEQLFIRLLYEDWDREKKVKPVVQGVTPPVKGTLNWFKDLESFCLRYEDTLIPKKDVALEKNGVVLMRSEVIERLLEESAALSRADKIQRLTEFLIAKLENEISGKYYSYTASEKKQLLHKYETYFGKREWKGDIYALYEDFLAEQRSNGIFVPSPVDGYDVYDLAALAYLYKRIKEDKVIREAGHVVIDEAQDFGMSVYASLKYCLSKCTYTIMGDVSQNISADYGLNDWSELRKLMLPGEFDYFGLLRKSYRNTVEISDFATDILYHGSFRIYPVEPIIRHGKEVVVKPLADFDSLIDSTLQTVNGWTENGMETIAVICADEEEAGKVRKALQGKVPLLQVDEDKQEYKEGVMVLSIKYTKGLEFDAVLLFDASEKNYPANDGYVKRLYVAATRALHELVVQYSGTLTPMIGTKVPEERKKKAVVKVAPQKKPFIRQDEDKTHEEQYREWVALGEEERQRRDNYGPRKIDTESLKAAKEPEPAASAPAVQKKQKGLSFETDRREEDKKYVLPTYLERRKQELKQAQETVTDFGEFGDMPDNSALAPAGHPRIDCSVRFSMKGTGYYDVTSNYGTLRITPLSADTMRISFAKGQGSTFPPVAEEMKAAGGKYRIRESAGAVEISTDRMTVKVEKRTGALLFLNAAGKAVLAERPTEPRQVSPEKVWIYLQFDKKESLIAKGPAEDKLLPIGSSAKYISYGSAIRQMPALASSKGYELYFPAGSRVLCCNISMYGPYVAMEDTGIIDFYIKIK